VIQGNVVAVASQLTFSSVVVFVKQTRNEVMYVSVCMYMQAYLEADTDTAMCARNELGTHMGGKSSKMWMLKK
jgi:ABC-type enterochelin transport system permease subunit